MFIASTAGSEAMQVQRIRAVVAEGLLRGVRVAWFGTEDVDLETGSILYSAVGDGGDVARWWAPPPIILMSPIKPRNRVDNECLDWFRPRALVTHGPVPTKLEVSRLLLGTPVASHIIPFADVPREDPCPTVFEFLGRYGRIVLKPDLNGLSGRGVSFLARDGDDIVWHQGGGRERLNRDEVTTRIEERASRFAHIVQVFVVSRARGNRTFDVRVHTHKNGHGEWDLVRTYVRLSEEGLLVSNTGQGGYQGDVDHFFANAALTTPPVTERIRDLGRAVSRTLEEQLGYELDELGVDVLVDPQQRLWVAEVNSRPVSRYHDFERARLALDYAVHLLDRRKQADNPRIDRASGAVG